MYEREVYPHSPLEFVAAELRFPYAPRLGRPDAIDSLTETLRDILPIPRQDEVASYLLAADGPHRGKTETVHRLMNRGRTASVKVSQASVTIETTHYTNWGDFRSLLDRCLKALAAIDAIVGVERAGLRYVNEVRVTDPITTPADWLEYLNPSLVCQLKLTEQYEVQTLDGALVFRRDGNAGIVFRYATLDGPGVIGDDPLRKRSRDRTGPVFVLDVDSFWEPALEDLADFDTAHIVGKYDELHEPVGVLFELSLSERLRDILRGKDG